MRRCPEKERVIIYEIVKSGLKYLVYGNEENIIRMFVLSELFKWDKNLKKLRMH